jgi:hypothetical protein
LGFGNGHLPSLVSTRAAPPDPKAS